MERSLWRQRATRRLLVARRRRRRDRAPQGRSRLRCLPAARTRPALSPRRMHGRRLRSRCGALCTAAATHAHCPSLTLLCAALPPCAPGAAVQVQAIRSAPVRHTGRAGGSGRTAGGGGCALPRSGRRGGRGGAGRRRDGQPAGGVRGCGAQAAGRRARLSEVIACYCRMRWRASSVRPSSLRTRLSGVCRARTHASAGHALGEPRLRTALSTPPANAFRCRTRGVRVVAARGACGAASQLVRSAVTVCAARPPRRSALLVVWRRDVSGATRACHLRRAARAHARMRCRCVLSGVARRVVSMP